MSNRTNLIAAYDYLAAYIDGRGTSKTIRLADLKNLTILLQVILISIACLLILIYYYSLKNLL